MKPTRSGTKWVHVSCALWIPEVRMHAKIKTYKVILLRVVCELRLVFVVCSLPLGKHW